MPSSIYCTKIKQTRKILRYRKIEKGNKAVSPERAARFAKALGHSAERFVELSLQSLVDEAGLKLKVVVDVA